MNITLHSIKIDMITTEQSNIFRLVNYVSLSSLIGVFGMASNIINMIVFHKQGFTTTINISFFALALSDFLCLLTLEWLNVCLNPYMETDAIPFVPIEFGYLTGGGWFHICFGRITSWITVFITAERCLSVALPLKVKLIVSPRKTFIFMSVIFTINLLMLSPEYCAAYLDWKFVLERNRTLIGIVYRSNSEAVDLAFTLTSISGMLSFAAVIILTMFLTIKLAQKSNWHNSASGKNNAQSEARSLRDKKTIKMVAMIAAVLIACYTPGAIISLVTTFEPEFSIVGMLKNSFFAAWSFVFVCNSINSSVNMLLYYNMSTKYRETFKQLFANCKYSSVMP